MNIFGDLFFFVCLAFAAIPAIFLGIKEKSQKGYGLALSLIVAALAVRDSPVQAFYMATYCMWQLAVILFWLRIRTEKGRRKGFFRLALAASLLPLAVYKATLLAGAAVWGFIGISYMTFKALQIIIEIYDGLIEECRPSELIYFMLFFPCLESGPIDRSRRFTEDVRRHRPRAEYLELLGKGLFRLCQGLTYKFVLGAAVWQAVVYLGSGTDWWQELVYMYAYGLYLFFDFAGFSLMAVGTGCIFGIETPMNFDKPFMSVDIKDFWDRWHISLSHWFRDFVFSRFMMASIKGKWFKNKLTGASAGFMVNMLLMGVWHGIEPSYILYGAYHGALLSLTEIYQKKSKFYKKHKKQKAYRLVSGFVTFNLVMFGFFIFSGRLLEIV